MRNTIIVVEGPEVDSDEVYVNGEWSGRANDLVDLLERYSENYIPKAPIESARLNILKLGLESPEQIIQFEDYFTDTDHISEELVNLIIEGNTDKITNYIKTELEKLI